MNKTGGLITNNITIDLPLSNVVDMRLAPQQQGWHHIVNLMIGTVS